MTTLFNIFCPIISCISINNTMLLFFLIVSSLSIFLFKVLSHFFLPETLINLLFPVAFFNKIIFFLGFFLLSLFNLSSLLIYSFPTTTCFSFNFSLAFLLWSSSLFFFLVKPSNVSTLLPNNSPWFLSMFLCLVEMVSISVRPITLCFRLLANMSAGHVLLSLICKLKSGLWSLGVVFGLLELMVCLVQSFVFFMLISVYLEESFSH